ncbi:MAG: hypothetical protein OEZ13_06190 [Spirochaetia bacterium]|nr:hypothetical protein [Spirochaetia bacterium]
MQIIKKVFIIQVIVILCFFVCQPEEPLIDGPGITDFYYSTVSVLPYESSSFHESVYYGSNIFVANPANHRIVKYDSGVFAEALYHDGTALGWHTIDAPGDTSGLNTPVDFIIDGAPDYIWILDQNGINKRSFTDGSLISNFNPLSSTYTQCQTVLQIEYETQLIALTKDVSGNYYICYFDETAADFNLVDSVLMTHPETGRTVINVPHFKAIPSGIYLLQELSLINALETPVFFLERRDSSFDFMSGVYLYEASGISFFTNSSNQNRVLTTGRQRNYDNAVTVFNEDLDRVSSFDVQASPKLNGIMLYNAYTLTLNSFEANTTATISY